MIVRQPWNPRTVLAPSYRVDLATNRLTIDVRNGALLEHVPATIRRATVAGAYAPTMPIVVECRQSPSPPALPAICGLAEALADSWDVNGPIALVANGIDVRVVTFALGMVVSARAEHVLHVFADSAHMESFLQRFPISA